jgi:hypothetical protein
MSASGCAIEQTADRSQLREWRRLLVVVVLMLSPLLVIVGALEGLAWRIGETMPMSLISKWQDGAAGRLWRGGDGHSYLTYKLARAADLKPEILAIGPSRANSFRAAAFSPYTFFNAGLAAWTFEQYRRFLELSARDGYAPKILVFDLDYWMLSSGFDHYWVNRFDEQPSTHAADLLRVIGELREEPLRLWQALPAADHLHGLYALLAGDGFRADGSLPVKSGEPDAQRLLDDGTAVGIPPVVLTDHIAPEQVAKFDEFVAFARERHIALIGIQLPFYEKILNGLNGNPDAGIWREFASAEWQQHIAASGVLFFDFADMPEYRDKPEYFSDSLDPDARVVDHIMQLVMTDPRVRALLPKTGAPAAR